MFGFDGFGLQTIDCTVEITLGNQVVNKQRMTAPYLMVYKECENIIAGVAQDNRPIKIRFITYDFNDLGKQIENFLEFRNNAYLDAFKE